MSQLNIKEYDLPGMPRFKKIILCIHTNIINTAEEGMGIGTFWGVGDNENYLMLLRGDKERITWEKLVSRLISFHSIMNNLKEWYKDPSISYLPPIEILINDHCEAFGLAKDLEEANCNSKLYFTQNKNFDDCGKENTFWIPSDIMRYTPSNILSEFIYIKGKIVSKHLKGET